MNNAGGVDILILITTHQLQLTLHSHWRLYSAERNMILHVVKAIHVFCLNLQSSILRRHAVEYMYVSFDSDDQTCDNWQQRISISKWLGADNSAEG